MFASDALARATVSRAGARATLRRMNEPLAIEGRPRDIGGFEVRRVLPSVVRRTVGPFVFFDHMGPATLEPAHGMDVRPHPHIALATITYLFEGAIHHRDSLGSSRTIRPGDVNWMVAGRGIVHSERTPPDERAHGGPVHGLQTWVGLPTREEDREPLFEHHDASALPVIERSRAKLRVVAGSAYGKTAPTGVLSPTLYVHATLDDGAELEVTDEHEERAVYVPKGEVTVDGRVVTPGTMLALVPGARVTLRAERAAHVMLVGGAPLDGPRHVWWNFVASSQERIERAKADWREGRFPKVPGDEVEFIPLPER